MTGRSPRYRRVVCFDLDDTLYLERTYARSGFAAVDRWAAEELGMTGLFDRCWQAFEAGERSNMFNRFLAGLGQEPEPGTIAAMIAVYRNHDPEIALAEDAAAWLRTVGADTGLALISDGYQEAQTNKVGALGLAALGFEPILLTDVWGRDFWKPHARAFETVEQHFGLSGAQIVYVADNPEKDFLAPRRLGWRTVQIVRPERIHRVDPPSRAHCADCVIESLATLDEVLTTPSARTTQ